MICSMICYQHGRNMLSTGGTPNKTIILDPIEFGDYAKCLKWWSQSRPMTDLVRKSQPKQPDNQCLFAESVQNDTWLVQQVGLWEGFGVEYEPYEESDCVARIISSDMLTWLTQSECTTQQARQIACFVLALTPYPDTAVSFTLSRSCAHGCLSGCSSTTYVSPDPWYREPCAASTWVHGTFLLPDPDIEISGYESEKRTQSRNPGIGDQVMSKLNFRTFYP